MRVKKDSFHIEMILDNWDQKIKGELWNLFNGKYVEGEHFRVFPISNWTEMDVGIIQKGTNRHTYFIFCTRKKGCLAK